MSEVSGRVMSRVSIVWQSLVERYRGLPLTGKVVFWVWNAFHVMGMAWLVYIGPMAMMQMMADWANSLRESEYGVGLIIGCIILASIPPMMGYGTAISLCGFAFGVQKGWMIASSGCVLGASVSFLLTRRLIGIFAPLLKRETTFRALSHAVRVKGLPLVVLIRLCPFPFPYSNAFFASIETVTLWQFFIATLAITPKLFLHVWIGHRTYLLFDEDERGQMDSKTKIVNGVYIFFGSLLGIGTSWYVYRLTMGYVSELVPEGEMDLEAALIDDVDALLDGEEDDSDEHDEATRSLFPSSQGSKSQPIPSSAAVGSRTPISGRNSDQWDAAFSDFDDDAEERVSLELGLPRPAPVTATSQSSVTTLKGLRDKRAD